MTRGLLGSTSGPRGGPESDGRARTTLPVPDPELDPCPAPHRGWGPGEVPTSRDPHPVLPMGWDPLPAQTLVLRESPGPLWSVGGVCRGNDGSENHLRQRRRAAPPPNDL